LYYFISFLFSKSATEQCVSSGMANCKMRALQNDLWFYTASEMNTFHHCRAASTLCSMYRLEPETSLLDRAESHVNKAIAMYASNPTPFVSGAANPPHYLVQCEILILKGDLPGAHKAMAAATALGASVLRSETHCAFKHAVNRVRAMLAKLRPRPLDALTIDDRTWGKHAEAEVGSDVAQCSVAEIWVPRRVQFANRQLNEFFQDCVETVLPHSELVFAAQLYERGIGGKAAVPAAVFEEAAALGHAGAQQRMFSLLFRTDEQKAVGYLKRAAAQGLPNTLLRLSSIYNGFSLEVKQNREIAKLLCMAAAEYENDPDATFCLQVADLIEGTFGATRDFQQGIQNAVNLQHTNQYAAQYLASLRQSSRESLLETDDVTLEDLDYLQAMGLWTDAEDSQGDMEDEPDEGDTDDVRVAGSV
jgi:TPR repeat protein